MAKLQVYTIEDKKMQTHLRPMYVSHVVEIQRNIIEILKDGKNNLSKFPEDFQLWKLGTYEEKTATHEIFEKPEFVMNIMDLKTENPKL